MSKARMLGYQKTGATNAKAAPPYWQVKLGAGKLGRRHRRERKRA